MNLMYSPDESIKGDTQIVVKGPEGIVEKELSQGMFVQDMQNILPLVEAGILPKDLAVEIAKDFARSRGYNVDAFAKSGAGMSPRRSSTRHTDAAAEPTEPSGHAACRSTEWGLRPAVPTAQCPTAAHQVRLGPLVRAARKALAGNAAFRVLMQQLGRLG